MATMVTTDEAADTLVPLEQVTVVGRIHSLQNLEGSDQDSGSETFFSATQAVDYNLEDTQDPTGIVSLQESESDNDSCEIIDQSQGEETMVATDT